MLDLIVHGLTWSLVHYGVNGMLCKTWRRLQGVWYGLTVSASSWPFINVNHHEIAKSQIYVPMQIFKALISNVKNVLLFLTLSFAWLVLAYCPVPYISRFPRNKGGLHIGWAREGSLLGMCFSLTWVKWMNKCMIDTIVWKQEQTILPFHFS